MPPPNLCGRRKRLYQRQLDETTKFLAKVLETGFSDAVRTGLAPALADVELVEALEEILIPYVVCGVARDFERLRKSNALFCTDAKGKGRHPPLSKVLPPGQPSPDGPPSGFTLGTGVSAGDAYYRYFDWYIDPDDVGAGISGVDAFYQRYPLLDHAVRTVTSHYQNNIKLACQRVAADWADIQKAFFPGRTVNRLTKIRTTGNDFHKGGKQVLILTFDVSKDPAAGAGSESGRVVYKPSAVEIDCRIVGKSSTFQTVQPKGPKDAAGYTQQNSLTELINGFNPPGRLRGGFKTRALPTYRILPYNRGSVPDAYGYIEYLTHEPASEAKVAAGFPIAPEVGAEVRALSLQAVKKSDWITDIPADAQVFFHQLGGLMAMATAISLCDLHVQNLIVHDRLPHLIDLEEALKMPMKRVGQTYLDAVLHQYHDPETKVLQIAKDRTSNLKVPLPRTWEVMTVKSASSVLYVRRDDGQPARPAAFDPPATPWDRKKPDPVWLRDSMEATRNRTALIMGVVDVVDALAEHAGEVTSWVAGLRGTLARYVTRGTAQYATAGRHLYLFCGETDVSALNGPRAANDNWYDAVNSKGAFWPTVEYPFRSEVNVQRSNWKPGDWAPPFFALEHPDHVWRDYLNCDVPCFYHLLGDAFLLNSKGDRIDVNAAIAWQGNITTTTAVPAAWPPNQDGSYLSKVPVDMIVKQLNDLKTKCADPAGKRKFLMDMLYGIRSLDSEFTSVLDGLGRAEKPKAAVPAGAAPGR